MDDSKTALEKIFLNIFTLPSEKVLLEKSLGRVSANDLFADWELPPYENSAMDGYAVQAQELQEASRAKPLIMQVVGVQKAGSSLKKKIKKGQAIKIMTGSPIPFGCDAVVMKEFTEPCNKDQVKIYFAPKAGDHIRSKGEDVHKGDLFLKKGTLIRPYEIALLASQGVTRVPVIRQVRATVFSTGDELVKVSSPLTFGKIRNSNGPSIAAALSRWNVLVKDRGIVKDDPKKIEKILKESVLESDLIIVSGGVSVGDFDFTKIVLEKLGIRTIFWKVAIKPGKPLFFGMLASGENKSEKAVFGLPGNPISALVCLEEFVRPAVEKMSGFSPKHPSYHLQGKTVNSYFMPKVRQQYIFCKLRHKVGSYELEIIQPQGSAMMGMASSANALALGPVGLDKIKVGETLFFRWLK